MINKNPIIASTSTSQNLTPANTQNKAENTRKPGSTTYLTFKRNGDETIENTLGELFKQYRNGQLTEDDLKPGTKFDKHLSLAKLSFDKIQEASTIQSEIHNGLASTIALHMANGGVQGGITPAAFSRMKGSQQDSSGSSIAPLKPQAPRLDTSVTVTDKVKRIIEMATALQKDYPQQISSTQINKICEGLTSGKEQLNVLDGWDATVDSFKSVIDRLETFTVNEVAENTSLKAKLSKLENTRKTLQSTIDKLKGDIKGASGNDANHKAQLAKLGNEIASLQSDISRHLELISKQGKNIDELNNELKVCKNIITGLTAEKIALEQKLNDALTKGNSDDVKALESEIRELENKIVNQQKNYLELEANHDKLVTDNKDLQESNTTQTATISDLKEKLNDALLKREKSGKHTAELIAGIAGLIASTALFLVALLPKDSVSEESSTDTVDTSDLKAELQSMATDLQAQIAQDDAAISNLNDIQDKLTDYSAAIEKQEASLTEEEETRVKEAGDKAYQQALDKAEAEAFKDPANQAFDVNGDGIIVPTGELTAEAQAQCEAQATTAREAAEAQEKQNIDAQLQRANQLDSQIQAASSNAASAAERSLADQIATQAQLDQINALNSQIPDEIATTTNNIENTNNGLSTAGFATTLASASTLAVGGGALIGHYIFGVRKHKDVEAKATQIEGGSESVSQAGDVNPDTSYPVSAQINGSSNNDVEIENMIDERSSFLNKDTPRPARRDSSFTDPISLSKNQYNPDAYN
ncbi:hypothetical protein L8P27_05155 [Enterobacter asburiae]|uniref:hypothetical protein n=1 Tax=Enterobacter asburiae TaxID=61645 RepID=UPI0020032FD7|nr:hypothetical protein [Enterobacter asburiae]MCK7227240.1 hypothetical protein [Enterobacter asburiae]